MFVVEESVLEVVGYTPLAPGGIDSMSMNLNKGLLCRRERRRRRKKKRKRRRRKEEEEEEEITKQEGSLPEGSMTRRK